MTEKIHDLLQRLDARLKVLRPAYYETLNPPIEREVLDAWEKELPAPLPPAYRELYLWHNGSSDEDSFLDNRCWMQLQAAKDAHKTLTDMIGTDFTEKNWWLPTWIPFLESFGGDHFCVDVGGAFKGVAGQVLEFIHDDR